MKIGVEEAAAGRAKFVPWGETYFLSFLFSQKKKVKRTCCIVYIVRN